MGDAYRHIGKREEALQAYRNALRAYPQYSEAKISLAALLQEMGQTEEALHLLRDVVAMYPNLPEGHLALASALRDVGLREEACEESKLALATAEDDDPELVDHVLRGQAQQMIEEWC